MYELLPDPRPEESLYSVLARLGRYLHVTEAGPFMRVLLGRRLAIASHDLPGGLSSLVRNLAPDRQDMAIDLIIDRLTLYPFHTAFMPSSIRDAVRAAMRDDVTGVYTRLGLAAFKVRPPERLRYCPHCLDEMEAAYSDAWWRRDHQLPGVPFCPSHGSVLLLSDVVPGDVNRHSFIAATRSVCRPDAAPAISGIGTVEHHSMLDLGKRAAKLLAVPPLALSFQDRAQGYRERLADVGLMRSPQKVDHQALAKAFNERWGRLPDYLPGLHLVDDIQCTWLAAMVRGGRRAAHPLQHVLLEAMLEAHPSIQAVTPFGTGPWLCRNPVAEHYDQPVIESIDVRRSCGVLYGDFSCTCGYLYTRPRTPDGLIGEPKFRRFGPLLVPALRLAIRRNKGLRETARLLGLDPKTMLREAAMAGVAVKWKTAPSGAIPKPELAVLPERQPRHRPRSRAKRDWMMIDTRLARLAQHAASQILAERPPVRVTRAAVERRIARRDWILKRSAKLPQTVQTVAAVTEGITSFQERRLSWHVSLAIAGGNTRPFDVLRSAGLHHSWLPRIVKALDHARLQGRAPG